MNSSDTEPAEKVFDRITKEREEINRAKDDEVNHARAVSDPSWEKRFDGFKVSTIRNIYSGESEAVRDWADNEWCDRVAVRDEYHCNEFALQTVLIWERMNMPQSLHAKEWRMLESKMKYASHPDLVDHYAFPYFFIKLNPQFATPWAPKGAQFRIVVPVRSLTGEMNIKAPLIEKLDPESPAIVDWSNKVFKLQASKKIFELRDTVIHDHKFIEDFIQFNTEGRELFAELKAHFQKRSGYVDVDEHWATFLALWVMHTHVFYLFNATPYVMVYSVAGQGKTRLLKVLCYLSRNGRLIENPTAAAIYRQLDVTRAMLAVDEADKVKEEVAMELLGIWNSGYEEGHSVPRWDLEEKRLANFTTYSPKAFATNKKLDNTLASRCIRVTMLATNDDEVQFRTPVAIDPVFAEIRDELNIWAIDSTPALLAVDTGKIVRKFKARFEEELRATGELSGSIPPRTIQVLTPILAIYDFLHLDEDGGFCGSERENLRKFMAAIIADKRSTMVPWKDQEVIISLFELAKANELTAIHSADVLKRIKEKEGSDNADEQFTSSLVGLILDKYFPEEKRVIHGKTEWLPKCRDSEERIGKVQKIMDRLNIEYSESKPKDWTNKEKKK